MKIYRIKDSNVTRGIDRLELDTKYVSHEKVNYQS